MSGTIEIEVAPGELIDKLAILEINHDGHGSHATPDRAGLRGDCPATSGRLAFVYVRQSTLQQVERHQESTRLQYAPMDRTGQFGWMKEQIVVIDDDLGRSGATTEGRLGFQRLVPEVGLGHIGLVLGVEMSRLARSCRHWHQLSEICALFDRLIANADGVYDPANGSRRSGDRRDRRRSSCGKTWRGTEGATHSWPTQNRPEPRSVRRCGRARSGTGESSSPPRSRLRADRRRDCGGRASRGPCRLSHAAAPTTVCLGRNNPRPASRRRRSRAPRNRASARSAPDPYGNAIKSPPMTLRAFFIRTSRHRIRNRRWKMVPLLRPRADNVLRCPPNS